LAPIPSHLFQSRSWSWISAATRIDSVPLFEVFGEFPVRWRDFPLRSARFLLQPTPRGASASSVGRMGLSFLVGASGSSRSLLLAPPARGAIHIMKRAPRIRGAPFATDSLRNCRDSRRCPPPLDLKTRVASLSMTVAGRASGIHCPVTFSAALRAIRLSLQIEVIGGSIEQKKIRARRRLGVICAPSRTVCARRPPTARLCV